MNELIVSSVLRLLALLSSSNKGEDALLTKKYVENYLVSSYGKSIGKEKHIDFIQYLAQYAELTNRQQSINKLLDLINEQYLLKDRLRIYITLLNFIRYTWNFKSGFFIEGKRYTKDIDAIGAGLRISESDRLSIKQFVFNELYRIEAKSNLLLIGEKAPTIEGIKFHRKEGLKGLITILYVANGSLMLLQYKGRAMLEINRKIVFPNQLYTITPGTYIAAPGLKPIYYGELLALVLEQNEDSAITLIVKNLEFTFINSTQGIHNLSFTCHTGEMVAIMGDSGVGKSTLLNILAGLNKKYQGTIQWNGYDYKTENSRLRDLMGFITQEDSLIEDLSVYENIYFSSRLSLGNIPEKELQQLVEMKLVEMGLFDIKHLTVGSPTNKIISGGQRKRLSIAIELMREPKVLFVDEPTSGLSSADSEKVMNILKTLTLQGILIFVNIHQPSSEIFKLFDKLLVLDQGGLPIFYGNPLAGILHFKNAGNWVDKKESVCESCGNVKPEIIFDIIAEKKVNEFGEPLDSRKIAPKLFHELHLKENQEQQVIQDTTIIPDAKFTSTSHFSQFKLFFSREILARTKSREFLLFSLSVPLLLSIIIATVSKKFIFLSNGEPSYSFYHNQNIPPFFFMAVIACMFIGMIISADAIFRNKKTQTRETYVKLSPRSYLRSKVVFFLLLSAIQTLIFTIVGVWVLQIHHLFFILWAVLFSIASFGNIAGLLISANFKSIAGIYLAIPFLFLPQILLSGVVVNFDQLYYRLTSQKVVPVIGDIMASRWAYEAIVVTQFTKNPYEAPLFASEMEESRLRNGLLYLIPLINQSTEQLKLVVPSERATNHNYKVLLNAMEELNANTAEIYIPILPPNNTDNATLEALAREVDKYNGALSRQYNRCIAGKERIMELQMKTFGEADGYITFRNRYQNTAIVDLVRNRGTSEGVRVAGETVTVTADPIFRNPPSTSGRAQLYAPYKRIGSTTISTFGFNTAIIWIMFLIGYLSLIYYSSLTFIVKHIHKYAQFKWRKE